MAIYTQRYGDWLRIIAPEEFNDDELFRIVVFFVFHSPCKNTSAMRKTLSEYNWNTPWRKPYYLNKQLKEASSNSELLFSADTYDNLESALEQSNLLDDFPNQLTIERLAFHDSEKNQFMSVFKHIRNSFSHGRLNIFNVDGECVFAFEDVVPKNNTNQLKISARMIIKKSTLLNWIDIIEGGEIEYGENSKQLLDS